MPPSMSPYPGVTAPPGRRGTRTSDDVEALQAGLGGLPALVDAVDAGHRRSLTQGGEQPVDRLPPTLRDALHRPIGPVANPARERLLPGSTLDEVTEANPLDVAAH